MCALRKHDEILYMKLIFGLAEQYETTASQYSEKYLQQK